jgi:hypothetical protein
MKLLARFGLVEVLVLDGEPAFIAERFKEFMITNSIKHIISLCQWSGGEYHKNG